MDEYSEIKNHPSIGVHILSGAKIFENIVSIVLHHHERWDGKGYPKQLKGEDIPQLARIAAIADAFDAMTSTRSYREALSIERATEEIEKNKGTQFAPVEADAMLALLKENKDEIIKISKINKAKKQD